MMVGVQPSRTDALVLQALHFNLTFQPSMQLEVSLSEEQNPPTLEHAIMFPVTVYHEVLSVGQAAFATQN